MISGASSPQYLGGHGPPPDGERRAPSRVQGQGPWSGGRSPLKHFCFLNVQWKPQIWPLFWNLERQKIKDLCYLRKKITCVHETGVPGAKLGGQPPRPEPKTATDYDLYKLYFIQMLYCQLNAENCVLIIRLLVRRLRLVGDINLAVHSAFAQMWRCTLLNPP